MVRIEERRTEQEVAEFARLAEDLNVPRVKHVPRAVDVHLTKEIRHPAPKQLAQSQESARRTKKVWLQSKGAHKDASHSHSRFDLPLRRRAWATCPS